MRRGSLLFFVNMKGELRRISFGLFLNQDSQRAALDDPGIRVDFPVRLCVARVQIFVSGNYTARCVVRWGIAYSGR